MYIRLSITKEYQNLSTNAIDFVLWAFKSQSKNNRKILPQIGRNRFVVCRFRHFFFIFEWLHLFLARFAHIKVVWQPMATVEVFFFFYNQLYIDVKNQLSLYIFYYNTCTKLLSSMAVTSFLLTIGSINSTTVLSNSS